MSARQGRPRLRLAVVLVAAALAGCQVAPKYERPRLNIPAQWKVEEPFRVAQPNDAAPKGPWWLSFGEPQLDALQQRALAESPTLDLARARLTQARSLLDAAEALEYPQAALGFRSSRARISANRALTNNNSPQFTTTQTSYVPAFTVAYEADLFGRVSSTIEGAKATAEQSAIDLENTRLLLTTDLATAYFNLRAVDIELDVLSRAIDLQRRALAYVKSRHELGATSGLDVAQQQALLDNTLTQVDLLRRQRGQFENAIATLTGTPAPQFSLPPQTRDLAPPVIPVGIPSDVLERRPDVASAERAMAAANAQVGVATAAFYPSVILSGVLGQESRAWSRLLDMPSHIWSLGAALVQPLFTGGRLDAQLEFAKAGYEATTANYRRVVLTAMQEVEDGINSITALGRAHAQAAVASQSARKVLELATSRYEGGVATSLDVITSQQAVLNTERQVAQLMGQRLLATVFLVKALGGDWQERRNLASESGQPAAARN